MVNWTVAIDVSRLHIFCRRKSCVVVDSPIYAAEADTTQTGLFCRVWPAGENWA